MELDRRQSKYVVKAGRHGARQALPRQVQSGHSAVGTAHHILPRANVASRPAHVALPANIKRALDRERSGEVAHRAVLRVDARGTRWLSRGFT